MRLVARMERTADLLVEVSYNIEPDVGVVVASMPISGEHRFKTETSALGWIKKTVLERGIEKEKVWVEASDDD
jgi:hypothetical protein